MSVKVWVTWASDRISLALPPECLIKKIENSDGNLTMKMARYPLAEGAVTKAECALMLHGVPKVPRSRQVQKPED